MFPPGLVAASPPLVDAPLSLVPALAAPLPPLPLALPDVSPEDAPELDPLAEPLPNAPLDPSPLVSPLDGDPELCDPEESPEPPCDCEEPDPPPTLLGLEELHAARAKATSEGKADFMRCLITTDGLVQWAIE